MAEVDHWLNDYDGKLAGTAQKARHQGGVLPLPLDESSGSNPVDINGALLGLSPIAPLSFLNASLRRPVTLPRSLLTEFNSKKAPMNLQVTNESTVDNFPNFRGPNRALDDSDQLNDQLFKQPEQHSELFTTTNSTPGPSLSADSPRLATIEYVESFLAKASINGGE